MESLTEKYKRYYRKHIHVIPAKLAHIIIDKNKKEKSNLLKMTTALY